MDNEAETGSAGAVDREGHSRSSESNSSPLQTRAAFIKNWDWQSVVRINRGACERGRAQHGFNTETGAACEAEWEETRREVVTLQQTFDFLKKCHRQAPFLFFNGNTFASIGRELSFALFSDLPPVRKREVASAIAHYIAGVLGLGEMIEIVNSLSQAADIKVGDRVKTYRGSLRGVVVRLLPDGRVVWRPDGRRAELTALPESLLPDSSK